MERLRRILTKRRIEEEARRAREQRERELAEEYGALAVISLSPSPQA